MAEKINLKPQIASQFWHFLETKKKGALEERKIESLQEFDALSSNGEQKWYKIATKVALIGLGVICIAAAALICYLASVAAEATSSLATKIVHVPAPIGASGPAMLVAGILGTFIVFVPFGVAFFLAFKGCSFIKKGIKYSKTDYLLEKLFFYEMKHTNEKVKGEILEKHFKRLSSKNCEHLYSDKIKEGTYETTAATKLKVLAHLKGFAKEDFCHFLFKDLANTESEKEWKKLIHTKTFKRIQHDPHFAKEKEGIDPDLLKRHNL